MIARTTFIAVASTLIALTTVSGCAVNRGQSTMGEYLDDATITTRVKAAFIDARAVDATSITVETLNGEVMLSGFAKSTLEKSSAERIARGVKGVKAVRNELAVRN